GGGGRGGGGGGGGGGDRGGGEVVPRRQRGDPARHGLARERPRAQAVLPDLHGGVHGGLRAVRARAQPQHADHRPRAPGDRGWSPHAHVAGHHVGDLSVPEARHGHGRVGHGHHDGPHLRA